MPIKYFIYISDAKLDMIFDQIPKKLRNELAAKLKVDLKFFSASVTQQPPEKTRIHKLKLVTRFIRDTEHVGTVDAPDAFFFGKMPMRWGPYPTGFREYSKLGLVLFGATTHSTVLALGGSEKHVIGGPGDSPTNSGSSTPYLLRALIEGLGISYDEIPHAARDVRRFTLETVTFGSILVAVENMKGLPQQVSFLARKLLSTRDFPGVKEEGHLYAEILLGTPIYVALED